MYSFGDDTSQLGDFAWHPHNSVGTTHPVGQKKPNAWGLYDMHGNVYEWCSDWHDRFPPGAVTDPQGATTGSFRALRGGSWRSDAADCRTACRDANSPTFRTNFIGFRLALNSPSVQSPEAEPAR
jgi:formylglycine-generating enzyme required for sulfatase activity